MTRIKTQEEFEQEVENKYNSDFKCIGEYKGANTKIKFQHKCGYTFEATPKYLLKYGRCRQCLLKVKGMRARKTQEQFEQEVREVHGDSIEVISEYEHVRKNVTVKHVECGNEYTIRPDSLLRGSKCKKCLHNRYSVEYRKTTEEYSKELHEVSQGEYSLISEYDGAYTKVQLKHKECGHEYWVTPHMFYRGRRCPKWNFSKGEVLVEKVLNSLEVTFESQKEFDDLRSIKNLSYDFYIPEYNVVIEYQGKQHYKPVKHFGGEKTFKIQQKNDSIKREYAKEKGIHLLEIPYTKYTFESILEEIETMLISVKQGIV